MKIKQIMAICIDENGDEYLIPFNDQEVCAYATNLECKRLKDLYNGVKYIKAA